MDAEGSEAGASGSAPARVLAAGPYRFDLQDERVWRDGEPLRLGGKALSLLRVLMEQPQTLVTKDNAASVLNATKDASQFSYDALKANFWAASVGQIPAGANQ